MASNNTPLQEEILVELRQLNSETLTKTNDDGSIKAGDYEVPIKNPLVIENGDMLTIKSCFVDSVAQNSGKIRINEEDATMTINFGYYFLDYGFALPSDQYNTHRLNQDGHTTPEGKIYYLTESHTHDPAEPVSQEINNLQFNINYDKWAKIGKEATPIAKFNLQYQNSAGSVVKLHFEIKKKLIKFNSDQLSFNIDNSLNNQFHSGGFSFPIIARKDTFAVDSDSKKANSMKETGVIFDKAIGNDIPNDGNDTLEPKLVSLTRTIPVGDYTPDELGSIITEAFTFTKDDANQYITGATYSDNPILTTTEQLKADNGGTAPFFVATDKSDISTYIGTENFWVGTSQFSVIFNDNTNTFEIPAIHSHIYNEHGLQVIKAVGNAPKQFFANKVGGIYFNSLSPESLWSDKLGFDIPKMCVNPQNPEVKSIGAINNVRLSSLNLKDGLTTTGDLVSTDTLILKTVNDSAGTAYDRPSDSFGGIETAQQNYVPIRASTAFQSSDGDNNTPYYQIEVRGGVSNKKLGADSLNNAIGAIISRYYSSDSYTSTMDNSGSINYIHKGNPIDLSNSTLNVRILKPDGSLADDIGSDNTVFLSIIKQK